MRVCSTCAQARSASVIGGAHLVVGARRWGPAFRARCGRCRRMRRRSSRRAATSKARSTSPSAERRSARSRRTGGASRRCVWRKTRADVGIDRADAEVLRPADAQAGQVDRRHRPRTRQRVERVATAGRARSSPTIAASSRQVSADAAAHRPEHRDRRPAQQPRVIGHQAGRGPEADHAAQRGRNAQRAAGVGAGAQRQHVARQRRRRAARRAAGIELGVEGVAGGAPHRVAGVGARAHVGHVGLGRRRSRRRRAGVRPARCRPPAHGRAGATLP